MLTNVSIDWGSHASAKEYKNHLGNAYENYFSFAFVRNPWDRMVSAYLHRQQTHPRNEFATFEQYVYYAFHNRHTKFTRTQSSFVCEHGNIIVSFIGRFETLQTDMGIVLKHIQVPIPTLLEHQNTTQRTHYTNYYNNKTIQQVGDIFADDIKRFGYEYESK